MNEPIGTPATPYIPPQPGTVSAAADGTGSTGGSGRPLRILVVDDTMEVRMLVGILLQEEPTWTVVGEAANGAEAIKRAAETHPDLVLLDISMPVMDGLEALPGLRQTLPDGLLVLLTAFPIADVIDQAVAAGADTCLDKVNMASSLVPALRDLLASRPSRAGAASTDAPEA